MSVKQLRKALVQQAASEGRALPQDKKALKQLVASKVQRPSHRCRWPVVASLDTLVVVWCCTGGGAVVPDAGGGRGQLQQDQGHGRAIEREHMQ